MSEHNTPAHAPAAPVESESESLGGISMAPPTFSLMASTVTQQRPQNPAAPIQRIATPTDGPNVLPEDEQGYLRLATYIQALPARLRRLQHGSRSREFNSPNFVQMLSAVDQLAAQLQSRSLRVRFRAMPANTGGQYAFSENTLYLTPIDARSDIAFVANQAVHEFTHRLQDAAIEAALLAAGDPIFENAGHEIDREFDARRNGTTLSHAQDALHDRPSSRDGRAVRSMDRDLNPEFETASNTATPNGIGMRNSLRQSIASTYALQIHDNVPGARYRIDLRDDRHLILHAPTGEADLGELPQSELDHDYMRMHNSIMNYVFRWPQFNSLYTNPQTHEMLVTANFVVFHQGRVVCEFEERTPPAVVTAFQAQNQQHPQNPTPANPVQNAAQPQNPTPAQQVTPQVAPPAQRQVPTPLHGRIQNPNPNVLDQDRAMYNQLRAFVVGLVPRVQALIASPPAAHANLAHNPNATAAAQLLQRLAAALQAESIMIRFDAGLQRGMTQARYNNNNNVVVIQPFANVDEIAVLIPHLAHEFTHGEQDAATEQAVAASTTPTRFNASEDADREFGGRRSGSYVSRFLQALGLMPNTTAAQADVGSDNLDFDAFETMRTGSRSQRRDAEDRMRMVMGIGYQNQYARNDNIGEIRADLTAENHVILFLHTGQRDIGIIPDTMTASPDIERQIGTLVDALPDRAALFQVPGRHHRPGRPYARLNIILFDQGRRVCETSIAPQAPVAAAPAAQNAAPPAAQNTNSPAAQNAAPPAAHP
jgi:hypothetical protein